MELINQVRTRFSISSWGTGCVSSLSLVSPSALTLPTKTSFLGAPMIFLSFLMPLLWNRKSLPPILHPLPPSQEVGPIKHEAPWGAAQVWLWTSFSRLWIKQTGRVNYVFSSLSPNNASQGTQKLQALVRGWDNYTDGFPKIAEK